MPSFWNVKLLDLVASMVYGSLIKSN